MLINFFVIRRFISQNQKNKDRERYRQRCRDFRNDL